MYGVYFQAAGVCDLEPVAYEFFTQAFVIYEEEIAVSDGCFTWIMDDWIDRIRYFGFRCGGL